MGLGSVRLDPDLVAGNIMVYAIYCCCCWTFPMIRACLRMWWVSTGRTWNLPSVVDICSKTCLLFPISGRHKFGILFTLSPLCRDVIATISYHTVSTAFQKVEFDFSTIVDCGEAMGLKTCANEFSNKQPWFSDVFGIPVLFMALIRRDFSAFFGSLVMRHTSSVHCSFSFRTDFRWPSCKFNGDCARWTKSSRALSCLSGHQQRLVLLMLRSLLSTNHTSSVCLLYIPSHRGARCKNVWEKHHAVNKLCLKFRISA